MFMRASVQIVLLAVPGMFIASFLAACACLLILPSYDWKFAEALWFGSIASATDPVAVVAILREMGASKVLEILMEGESLLNDGVAVLIYDILEEYLTCEIEINFFLYIFQRSCQVLLGGPLFGYIMGRLAVACLSNTRNDSTIKITITVATCYLSYYISENILGLSGILAVVVAAIIIGSEKTCISPEVEPFLRHFWEVTSYFASTAIFLIIGIIVTETALDGITPTDWVYLIYLYLTLNLIRLLMLSMLYPLLNSFGYGMTWKNLIVMFWGGLREAVGTSLDALDVYGNEHLCQQKNLGPKFLFQTAGNVFLTLVINATTTKSLLNFLNLLEVPPPARQDLDNAVKVLKYRQTKTIATLKFATPSVSANWEVVYGFTSISDSYKAPNRRKDANDATEAVVTRYVASVETDAFMEETRIRVLRAMECSFWRHFRQGLLTDAAVLSLVRAVWEARAKPLKLILTDDLKKYWDTKRRCSAIPSLDSRLKAKLSLGYEIHTGFVFGLRDCINLLPQMTDRKKVFFKINDVLVKQRAIARHDIGEFEFLE